MRNFALTISQNLHLHFHTITFSPTTLIKTSLQIKFTINSHISYATLFDKLVKALIASTNILGTVLSVENFLHFVMLSTIFTKYLYKHIFKTLPTSMIKLFVKVTALICNQIKRNSDHIMMSSLQMLMRHAKETTQSCSKQN